MKKLIPAVLVFLCLGSALAIWFQKYLPRHTYTKVANRFVELANAADYSGIENLFNNEMSRTLPLEKATEFLAALSAQCGRIQKLEEPEGRSERMVFPAHFERGVLDMTLVLDAQKKIGGLIFKPHVDRTYSKIANRLVELVNAGNYSGVERLFNNEMAQALPLDKATEFLKGLYAQAGKIQKLDEPEASSEGMVFPAHCERAVLDMTLALDDKNRIAGLLFQPHVDKYTKAANRLTELLNAGDYSGVENLFNKQMSAALPLSKATQFFAGMKAQFGKIQKLDEPRESGGWTVFPAHFERGLMDLSLALDDENKIAGVTFKPSRH